MRGASLAVASSGAGDVTYSEPLMLGKMHASRQARRWRILMASATETRVVQPGRFDSATRSGIQNSLIAITMGGMS